MKILEFILNNKDYLEDLITRSTYHLKEVHLPMLKLMLFFTTTIALKLKEKSQEKYMKL